MSRMPTDRQRAQVTAQDLLRQGTPYDRGELWDGVWCVREPSGGWSGEVSTRILVALHAHPQARSTGWISPPEQGFFVARGPDRVLSPDVAYTSRARLPTLPARGFIECAPDFVVEVRSPTDSWTSVVEKCGVWIGHRVPVVWAVDPLRRVVAVMRPGEPVVESRGEAVVSAAPALPDFHLAVASLFDGLP